MNLLTPFIVIKSQRGAINRIPGTGAEEGRGEDAAERSPDKTEMEPA